MVNELVGSGNAFIYSDLIPLPVGDYLINHIKYLVISEKSRFYSYFSTFTIGGGVLPN
jgi:hypothetical protein